ncbi:beta strand repeat-containing protein [Richelia sinica]|uniref:beta strand repeat-containing protein n=1 Tax=Richelia sinica TaxID=1357545 RepID=UPI001C2C1968|nr:hypothetical protein [Richelia sinica]
MTVLSIATLLVVRRRNTSDNPSTTTRTIGFSVNDGVINSNLASRNVTITAVNDAAVVISSGNNLSYLENATATIDSAITVSDVDSTNLISATVSITSGFVAGQDILSFTNQNGITGSYNSTTGVLALTGASSIANYQAALRSITYRNTSDNPSTTTRTIGFSVNDGIVNSNLASRNVTITAVNDVPVLGQELGTSNTAFNIRNDNGAIQNLSFSGNEFYRLGTYFADWGLQAGTDTSSFSLFSTNGGIPSGVSGLSVTNNASQVLVKGTYTGGGTNIGFLRIYSLVTGQNAVLVETRLTNNGTLAAQLRIFDTFDPDQLNNITINDTTTLITEAGTTNVAESSNSGGLSVVMGGLTNNATVGFQPSYLGIRSGSELNSFFTSPTDPNDSSYDGGLNIGTEQTIGANQSATYSYIQAYGTTLSAAESTFINSIAQQLLVYTENSSATVISSTGFGIKDVDNTNIISATIQITGGYQSSQDLLSVVGILPLGIAASAFNAATGTLTLSGSATLANYQLALQQIGYSNTSDNPNTTTRTVSFTVNDGFVNSNTVTRNIFVTAVNDAAVVISSGNNLSYLENGTATIDSAITVSDVDSTNLVSATVSITSGFVTGQDILSFTNQNGITGSYNSMTGVLTLTGASSIANYQAALRSITYRNTSDNPSTTTRTIGFSVNDGVVNSNLASRNVTITAVNDAPAGLSLDNMAVAENQVIGTVVGNFSSTDPDIGNTFTYSLVTGTGDTNNALFTIIGNQLRTKAVFDFKTKNSYSILVRTTDQGGLFYNQQFTININMSSNQLLQGSTGDDFFIGNDGYDTIIGGAGVDTVDYGQLATSITLKAQGIVDKGHLGTDIVQAEIFIGNAAFTNAIDASSSFTNAINVNLSANTLTVFGLPSGDATFDVYNFTDVKGSQLGDEIIGDEQNNRLEGQGGDDRIYATTGNDTIIGGDGFDTVDYSYVDSAITLKSQGIVAKAIGGTDIVQADQFIGNAAYRNSIDASSSTTTSINADLSLNSLTVFGLPSGELTFDVANFQDVIASQSDDQLTGNELDNLLDGQAGDDLFFGTVGSDTMTGGSGVDTVDYSNLAGAIKIKPTGFIEKDEGLLGVDKVAAEVIIGNADYINIIDASSSTTASLEVDLFNNSFKVLGTAVGNLSFEAQNFSNVIGSQVADIIKGDSGNNNLRGEGGNDTLTGGAASDVLNGGTGIDTVSYLGSTSGVTVNLATGIGSGGDAAGDSFASLENATGSGFNDNLTGNTLNNILNGGAGNDNLSGSSGNDSVLGDIGNDVLMGGLGADTLDGGAGTDTASYATASAGVSVNLSIGNGTLGEANGDRLIGIERLTGSNYSDNLIGNTASNTLTANNGNDTLNGDAGTDTLIGGSGNDFLVGGLGNDFLTGGTGLDNFRFNSKSEGVDRITDFSVVDDTISILASGFGGLTVGTLSVSRFVIGSTATNFNQRFIYNSSNGNLFFDRDGVGTSFSSIQIATLNTGLALTNTDFQIV